MVQPFVLAFGKNASTTVCPRKSERWTGALSSPYRVAPARAKSGAALPVSGANAAEPGFGAWAAAGRAAASAEAIRTPPASRTASDGVWVIRPVLEEGGEGARKMAVLDMSRNDL